jgi:hypothetical protein
MEANGEKWMTTTEAARALGYETNGSIAVACRAEMLRCKKGGPEGRFVWLVSQESVLDVLFSLNLCEWRKTLSRYYNKVVPLPQKEVPVPDPPVVKVILSPLRPEDV